MSITVPAGTLCPCCKQLATEFAQCDCGAFECLTCLAAPPADTCNLCAEHDHEH